MQTVKMYRASHCTHSDPLAERRRTVRTIFTFFLGTFFSLIVAVTVIASGDACGLQKCLHFSSAGVGRACCSFPISLLPVVTVEKIGDLRNFQVDANSCTVPPENSLTASNACGIVVDRTPCFPTTLRYCLLKHSGYVIPQAASCWLGICFSDSPAVSLLPHGDF